MIRRLIDILLVIILVGIPLLFWITYTGPYQWIAEAQLSMMGEYEEKITVVLTLLVWMALCGLVAWMVGKLTGLPISLKHLGGRHQQIANRALAAALVIAPVVLVALGAYMHTLISIPPSHMSVSDLAAGKTYPTRYLTVEDAAIDPDVEYAISEGTGKAETHYFPLLPANYQPGEPIHAFLEVADDKRDAAVDPKAVYSGLVAFRPLPGMARVAFQRDELPPAPDYILLHFGETPADYSQSASGCFTGAVATAVIAVFILVRNFLLARRARPA